MAKQKIVKKVKHELTPFGKKVIKALEEQGMSQVQLAKEIGTSKQFLYLVLHGMRPGRKYLAKISDICMIEPDDLDMLPKAYSIKKKND